MDRWASLPGCSTGGPGFAAGLGGRVAAWTGGLEALANRVVQLVSQGQCSGRCSVMRRAEVETLAATLTSLRRIVALTALPWVGLARVPAAEARLNAMQAVARRVVDLLALTPRPAQIRGLVVPHLPLLVHMRRLHPDHMNRVTVLVHTPRLSSPRATICHRHTCVLTTLSGLNTPPRPETQRTTPKRRRNFGLGAIPLS